MGFPVTGQVVLTLQCDRDETHRDCILAQGYNLVALSFYIGELLHQPTSERFELISPGFLIWVFPSMFIAQRLRLGKYLGANIVAWGIVMMLHAIPHSFGPFFALRLLLGMLESCVAPILILIISMFYKKNEQVCRIKFYRAEITCVT